MKQTIFAAILLLAAGLAGCADNATDPAPSTNATTTPTGTTPATTPETTPTNTTPGEEPMSPPDCPEQEPSTAPLGEKLGYPEVVVTVSEPNETNPCYQFVAPATVEEGWTAFTLQNNGMSPHIMPMFRIDEGHTFEELLAAMAAGNEPEWVTPVGGVGVATPFSSGSVLMDLEPGTYVLICFFDGHHTKGMYWPLEVTASEEGAAREGPTADFTVVVDDYHFVVPENLTEGAQIMRVVNNGTEPHEAPLIKLDEGANMTEFIEAIEGGQGPPPGAGVGGVNVLGPGQEAYAIVDLTAGEYGFVCFVESEAHEGKPHIALGMITQFTVSPASSA